MMHSVWIMIGTASTHYVCETCGMHVIGVKRSDRTVLPEFRRVDCNELIRCGETHEPMVRTSGGFAVTHAVTHKGDPAELLVQGGKCGVCGHEMDRFHLMIDGVTVFTTPFTSRNFRDAGSCSSVRMRKALG
jgi:hypothetical protein